MKRIFCCLLAAVLILGTFAGCKKQDTPPTDNTGANQTENTETAQTENTGTTQTENTEKTKAFHVVIVHKDGTTKELSLETEEEYLGAALLNSGVVAAEENRFGMHIQKANGEKAVFEEDGAYWAVYVGEEPATKSTDLTPVEKGKTYKLVYTEPAPKKDTDDSVSYLFDKVFWPIALGQVDAKWDTIAAFAQQCGYAYVLDEGTFEIYDLNNRYNRFGGILTNENGYAEPTDLDYLLWEDGKIVSDAGVMGRNAKRKNPAYGININPYYGTFTEMDSLAEVEAYIQSYR